MTIKKKEMLSPVILATACESRQRRRSHRVRVEQAGLTVPLCLMSFEGQSTGMRRRIRKAIAEVKAQAARMVGSARSVQRNTKARAEKEERLALDVVARTPEVTEALDAMPPIPPESLASLDGERKGDPPPKPDSSATRIDFEVLPSMAEFFEDTSSNTWLLIGPAGSGKTSHAIMKMLKHCSLHPNGARYLLLRLTLPQLRDTTIKTFFDWIPRSKGKWNEDAKTFTLGGKYEFLFRAVERPDDVDNIKGMEITGYFVNEAWEVPREIKRMLDQRCGRYPKESYYDKEADIWRKRGTDKTLRILDTNPPDMEHWLVEEFIRSTLPNHRHVFNPAFENAHNLPAGYYERMKEDYRDSPDLYERYVLGKLGSTYRGKAIFPEWNTATHMARNPLKAMDRVRIHVGMDFGHTPCAVYTQVWPNGTWAVLEEILGDNIGISEFADSMITFQNTTFPGAEFLYYGDPDGARRAETDFLSTFDVLSRKGIYVEPGAVSIPVRVDAVKQRLRRIGGVLVSPSCRRVCDAFAGSYCYTQIGTTGVYTDKPLKNKWSHCMDALQYVATRVFSFVPSAETARAEARVEEQMFYQPCSAVVGY